MALPVAADHLEEAARKVLDEPQDDRIRHIREDRWIGYPVAGKILDKLEDLLGYPDRKRAPNLFIVGDTNNGKSHLVERFLALHPARDNLGGDAISAPVVLVELPPEPREKDVYIATLKRLFAPYGDKDTKGKLRNQALELLAQIGVRLLIFDEIQHITKSTAREQQNILDAIKSIGNDLRIPIVGTGTREAARAIYTNFQTANRFVPAPLPKWKDDDDLRRLLSSFEAMLPLEQPSRLSKPKMSNLIYTMTEGLIGEVSNLLTEVAVEAVRSGEEKITFAALENAVWTKPSERRLLAETF